MENSYKDEVKTCPKCKRNLPLNDKFWYFRKSGRQKGKRQSRCKDCMANHSQSQAESGYKADATMRWRNNNPEKSKRSSRRSREKNRDNYNKYMREYNRNYDRRQTEEYKLKHRVRQSNRRYQLKDNKLYPEFIMLLFELQTGKCLYCQEDTNNDYHVDHILAVSRGGLNDIYNLVIACSTCNQSKNAILIDEWLTRKGQDIEAFYNRLTFLHEGIAKFYTDHEY